jgi:hypothetical protein
MRSRTVASMAIALAIFVVAVPTAAYAAPGLPATLSADLFVAGGAPVAAAKAAAPRMTAPAATKADVLGTPSLLAWSLTVDKKIEYTRGTDVWLDGVLMNPNTQSIMNAQVTVEYFDSGSLSLGTESFPARSDLIPGGSWAVYSHILTKPVGTASYTVRAWGTPAGAPGVYLGQTRNKELDYIDSGSGAHHWFYTVTNNKPYSVNMLQVEAFEFNAVTDPTTGTTPMPVWSSAVLVDSMDATVPLPATLAPGASVAVELVGYNADQSTDPRWATVRFEGLPDPLPVADVFRFYNVKTGTHFYTGNLEERDAVVRTLGWLYRYEGVAYPADQYSTRNITPLYRFYNKKTGTHFYTADEAEKNNTVNNLGAIYQLDGITYFVSTVPGGTSIYRFYNVKTSTHFYTADTTERDRVINTLGNVFRYEGPVFYVWPGVR